MGRPSAYHPWRMARNAHPDVTIETRYQLPAGQSGAFDPVTNTVYLCRSLTQRERRATLAHELMHVVRGVVPKDLAWLEEKEDRVVDRLAARQLIDIEDFIDALCWAGHSANDECADELWVDLDMLQVWIDSLSEAEIEYIRTEVNRRK